MIKMQIQLSARVVQHCCIDVRSIVLQALFIYSVTTSRVAPVI